MMPKASNQILMRITFISRNSLYTPPRYHHSYYGKQRDIHHLFHSGERRQNIVTHLREIDGHKSITGEIRADIVPEMVHLRTMKA